MNDNTNYCPHCHGYYLINQITGEICRLGCNRYDCSHCGKIKTWKFTKALKNYLSRFHTTKLWTFNVRTNKYHNNKYFNKYSSEVWRRFCNNLRRDKSLTDFQRKFQFIKVAEFTKAGFIHFHVVFNCYLDQRRVYYHWNNALSSVFEIPLKYNEDGKLGNNSLGGVNFVKRVNKQNLHKYLAKYLVKSCKDISEDSGELLGVERQRVRIYTKSYGIVFFPKKQGVNPWLFVRAGGEGKTEALFLELMAVTSPELLENWAKNNEFLRGDP